MTEKLTYSDPVARVIAGLAALRGWTLGDLADAAGMPRGSLVQKMNHSQGRRLTGPDIAAVAQALGVDPFDVAQRHVDTYVTDDGPLRSVTRRYGTPSSVDAPGAA